jgi:hypothetical protein
MNSFDVFDTLLGRRYFTNEIVLKKLEEEYKIFNFVNRRKNADNGNKTFEEIYKELNLGDRTDEIMNREIELESEMSFPIQQNIDRVNDGDLLISDMYLPVSAILQLVRSIGLTKQITIYQSNGNKSNGKVWMQLQNNKPQLHVGDNTHSDFEMAKKFGISSELYQSSSFTELELLIFNHNLKHIGLCCREVRLRSRSNIWNIIACDLNIPLLFVLAELIFRKKKDYSLVFLGRDCQLLYRLYLAYYGLSYYLPFSRKVAYSQPNDAVDYLFSHSPSKPLFIDISSTGGTWEFLENKTQIPLDILVAIYSDLCFYTKKRPLLPQTFSYLMKNTEIGQTNILIEVFNCGDHGHLNKINNIGVNPQIQPKLFQAYFNERELPDEIIKEVHSPINKVIDLVKYYKEPIRIELSLLKEEELIEIFRKMSSIMCSQGQLLDMIKPFLEKENKYLEQFDI